jgi:flagellar biosynthetic protein FliP
MPSSRAALLIAILACALAFASQAHAQAPGELLEPLNAGLNGDKTLTQRFIQLFILVTVLSLAPGIAMMATSLPFMLIVLSIMRQGVGLQQAPPNMLLVSLAMFLTYFVMEPVFKEAWSAGVAPYVAGEISEDAAIAAVLSPVREFMSARASPEAIEALSSARGLSADGPMPLSVLTPAFALSEIQRAFEIGFVILLPFLIIDLLVASILTAMGMMMVPPAIVSLPFKIGFFVLTNGWIAVSGALVRGYS